MSAPARSVTAAFGQSILILAPHPDDEVVACHATAARARAAGARLSVLYFTHGRLDRASVWPWERSSYAEKLAERRHEAEIVASEMGLRPGRWPARPTGRVWQELVAVEAEIRAAVLEQRPDQIWVPAFEGADPDNDGANAVASRFAAMGLSVLEFAESNLAGGKPRSHAFPADTGAEEVLVLNPAERAAKQGALDLYVSERRNLAHVRTHLECSRPLPAHEYRRPPHPGRLWYNRRQWAPFAPPGAARTDPEDVAAAIKAFLSTEAPRPLTPA